MKLLLTRHGETNWNKEGKIQGITDIELNDNGREQAIKTSDKLKDEIKKIPSLNSDEIVCHIDEIKTEIIKEEINRILEKEYEIKTIEIKKNEVATDNNVYEIYSNKRRYIVKIYNNKKHTESMTRLHKKITKSNINVPQIICTIKNKDYANILNDNYMVVYSFIEGEAIGWNNARKIKFEIGNLPRFRRFQNSSDSNF